MEFARFFGLTVVEWIKDRIQETEYKMENGELRMENVEFFLLPFNFCLISCVYSCGFVVSRSFDFAQDMLIGNKHV